MGIVKSHSLFSDFDIYLFKSGKHYKLHEKLGAHLMTLDGEDGVYFAVWAPGAREVFVMGDFNNWDWQEHALYVRWDGSGIWEGFIPGATTGDKYKYRILSHHNSHIYEKADPYARYAEVSPNTASIVWDKSYAWKDEGWMSARSEANSLESPWSIYEVHLGSWKWHPNEDRPLNYQELTEELPAYVRSMGFTHVELMPVMEHPYPPSWGYQITGFFAPCSRQGTPEEFKALVDAFHREGIGVILDWVPSHFPSDGHGLATFDGSSVYEHPDRRKGYHPDWDSLIFNYERAEVRAFLISNALFWLEHYHADGLRVDAVASMIYLDYSREEGQWEPNEYGGREYLAAVDFLRELNAAAYKTFPDIQMIAEESTAFPLVTKPPDAGGLGFGMKWMMGWMNDTLDYIKNPPIYRKFHHNVLSFSIIYAFSENFILPFSHDEVVHGKGSLLTKMPPGADWEPFANLRALLAYMYTHPGGKLLFMGAELGQRGEWRYNAGLDWFLLNYDSHRGISEALRTLNTLYRREPALHNNFNGEGFEWIDFQDGDNSVVVFLRKTGKEEDTILVICHFTPILRESYRIGVPPSESWIEIFNSDHRDFWGGGKRNQGILQVEDEEAHGRPQSLVVTLPPLSVAMLKIHTPGEAPPDHEKGELQL